MNTQLIIVMIIIIAAISYAARTLFQKRRSFSNKDNCGSDCGCNGKAKSIRS